MVWILRRADPVDRHLHPAARAVLEADRHRQARGELAVHLALGCARADRAPRDQVGHELRRDRIEELGAGRQPHLEHVEQEAACAAQALVDVELAIERGVVDQALPAHGRARLLEVDAHHDHQVVAEVFLHVREALRVVERRDRVVYRAGPDYDDQPVVLPRQDVSDLGAALPDQRRGLLANRQLLHQDRRRDQRPQLLDPEVVGLVQHGGPNLPQKPKRRLGAATCGSALEARG
jgi:hypothetical protein